jgi:hypothetical protein
MELRVQSLGSVDRACGGSRYPGSVKGDGCGVLVILFVGPVKYLRDKNERRKQVLLD